MHVEIFPNVHEIKSVFGNRYVQQYLFAGETVVLLDAGVVTSPVESIFPYMKSIGLRPERLSMVVAMHADADHHGGLPAIKDASRNTLLACHKDDLTLIESPERLYQDRYNFLAQDHGLGFGREGMVHCPKDCSIDAIFSGGETVQLAKNWTLQFWHVPGHSAGHLAAYDSRNRAAFTSDAVQSGGYPTTDGKMAFGPTYYTVDAYLATVQFLESMPIEHMYSGHWPASHGAAVATFLDSSREFVLRASELLIDYFRAHRNRITLKQILADLSSRLGDWPESTSPFLQFALHGHLERLTQNGVIRRQATHPVEYTLA
jgi:glyoxylase-like metal-dependent hydrolase (beta-lactamase superfamily II)